MKPCKFPEANKELQKPAGTTDEECGPLPIFSDGRYCISRWKMNWKERVQAIVTGKVWIWVWSGSTQPPVYTGMDCPFTAVKLNMKGGDAK